MVETMQPCLGCQLGCEGRASGTRRMSSDTLRPGERRTRSSLVYKTAVLPVDSNTRVVDPRTRTPETTSPKLDVIAGLASGRAGSIFE